MQKRNQVFLRFTFWPICDTLLATCHNNIATRNIFNLQYHVINNRWITAHLPKFTLLVFYVVTFDEDSLFNYQYALWSGQIRYCRNTRLLYCTRKV